MAIKRAILKYGKENFTIRELEKCEISKLNEREKYYISLYNSYNDGYNSTIGGQDGAKPLKLDVEIQKQCIELYNIGFSLRDIAKEYNVDKSTVKHILEVNNIQLRTTRSYKYSQKDREDIIKDVEVMTRKEVCAKWHIDKSYLSQLINGKRRI